MELKIIISIKEDGEFILDTNITDSFKTIGILETAKQATILNMNTPKTEIISPDFKFKG